MKISGHLQYGPPYCNINWSFLLLVFWLQSWYLQSRKRRRITEQKRLTACEKGGQQTYTLIQTCVQSRISLICVTDRMEIRTVENWTFPRNWVRFSDHPFTITSYMFINMFVTLSTAKRKIYSECLYNTDITVNLNMYIILFIFRNNMDLQFFHSDNMNVCWLSQQRCVMCIVYVCIFTKLCLAAAERCRLWVVTF